MTYIGVYKGIVLYISIFRFAIVIEWFTNSLTYTCDSIFRASVITDPPYYMG